MATPTPDITYIFLAAIKGKHKEMLPKPWVGFVSCLVGHLLYLYNDLPFPMTTSGKDAHSKALENLIESNSYVAAWIGEEFEGERTRGPFTLHPKLSRHY